MLVGTDPGNVPETNHYVLMTSGAAEFEIQATTSSSGVWWLNIWVFTSAYWDNLITTYIKLKYFPVIKWSKKINQRIL